MFDSIMKNKLKKHFLIFSYVMKNKLENNLLIFFSSLLKEWRSKLTDKKLEEVENEKKES